MDVFIQYAIAASQFAMDDSGLAITADNAPSIGVYIALGHRRLRHHRARARGAARGRPAQDLAVLHSLGDHQPRGRTGVDPVRRQGTEPGDVHRLLRVGARGRRVVRDHPARRRRRDDRRRVGSGDYADERRRVRPHAGAVDPQRRPGTCEPAVRQGSRRLHHRRGRRRRHSRGTGTRQAPRRPDLRRARRLRRLRRRVPHHRAVRGRRGRRSRDGTGAQEGRHPPRAGRLHQRPRHVDALQRSARDAGDQDDASATTPTRSRFRPPSR